MSSWIPTRLSPTLQLHLRRRVESVAGDRVCSRSSVLFLPFAAEHFHPLADVCCAEMIGGEDAATAMGTSRYGIVLAPSVFDLARGDQHDGFGRPFLQLAFFRAQLLERAQVIVEYVFQR